MVGIAIAAVTAAAVLFAAGRIALSLFVRRETMVRVDRGFRRAGNMYLKACVVAGAVFILAVIVATAFHS